MSFQLPDPAATCQHLDIGLTASGHEFCHENMQDNVNNFLEMQNINQRGN